MSTETYAILARLHELAETDSDARVIVDRLTGYVEPRMFGLYDVRLNGWFNETTRELAPGFEIGPDDIVADIGCGDGGALIFCANQGSHVILADIDHQRVARAKQAVEGLPARAVEAYVTDANPLPLPDGRATRVICMEVLEHVDDPVQFVSELVRIGAPGALYLIAVPDHRAEQLQKMLSPPIYFEKPNHVRIFTKDSFAELIETSGLVIEQRSTHGFFWAMWWLLLNVCDVPLSGDLRHPVLDNWTRTWSAALATNNGLRLKGVLDDYMPKSQVIVARKQS